MPSVSGKIHFFEEIIDHALCLYLFDSVFVICVCSVSFMCFYMKNCNKVSKDMS